VIINVEKLTVSATITRAISLLLGESEKKASRQSPREIERKIGVPIGCGAYEQLPSAHSLSPVTKMMAGQTKGRATTMAGWKPERKSLDHVDCFPSQPKWTYRLETSVLDVKIPVAAPISKPPPLLTVVSLFLFPSRANFPPFLRRSLARVSRKRCNNQRRTARWMGGWMGGREGGRGGHGPANPKSPFPRYKASSLFSVLHVARLRAAIPCERSIEAADQIRAITNGIDAVRRGSRARERASTVEFNFGRANFPSVSR